MERHPLDPIALVCGLVTVAGGVIALLHQLGAFHLGPASVVLFGCGLLGAGGAALVVLMARHGSTAEEPGRQVAEELHGAGVEPRATTR